MNVCMYVRMNVWMHACMCLHGDGFRVYVYACLHGDGFRVYVYACLHGDGFCVRHLCKLLAQ